MSKKKGKEELSPFIERVDNIFFWAFFSIVLLSPYYRGLYFDYERFIFFAVFWGIAIFFFVTQYLLHQEKMVISTIPEWMFLFLILLYFVNIPWAADRGEAFRSFLGYLTFGMFFLLVENLWASLKDKKWLLLALGLNGIILTFLGVFYQFGWVSPSATPLGMSMRDLFIGGRLHSTFQYPNTAAAYFAMGYIALLTLFLREKQKSWFLGAIFLSFLSLSGFFFTYSRGGILTLPLALLLLFFLLPRQEKIKLTVVLFFSLLVFLLFVSPLENYLVHKNLLFFAFLFLGALILAGIAFLLSRVEEKLVSLSNRSLAGTAISLVGLAAIVFLLALYSDFLPPQLSRRLQDISFTTRSVAERFIFYQDAWKISLPRLLNGWGGGGWKALYLGYQSAPYFTESTHNFYLQILVEGGLLGLSLLAILLFSLFYPFIKNRHSLPSPDKILIFGVLSLLFMGFIHSFLDVNFSLGAYHFTIWFFAAGIACYLRECQFSFFPLSFRIPHQLLILLGIVFLVLSVLIFQGTNNKLQGDYYAQAGDNDSALYFYQKAAQFGFGDAETHLALSKIWREKFLKEGNSQLREESKREAKKAHRLSPFHYLYLEQLGILYVEEGQFEKGLRFLEEAAERAPLLLATYEVLVSAYRAVGDFYKSQGEEEKAKEYYSRGLSVREKFQKNVSRSQKPISEPENLQKAFQELSWLLEN